MGGGLNVTRICEAFQKFGVIEKIILGPEPAPLPLSRATALVQFSSSDSVNRAMAECKGTSLSGDPSRDTLDLGEASLASLCVVKDGPLSWDFTRPRQAGAVN